MAYLRTIKQSFFTSEDVVALTPLARLLYIGLWCEADRDGRFTWKPVTFRLRYLPTDACDIVAVCEELLARGLVVRYGDGLAYIPAFLKHQRPNARETESQLPPPTGENTRQHGCTDSDHASARVETPVSTGETRVREGKEREVEGKEREGKRAAVAAFPAPVPMSNDAWQETITDWNQATHGVPELPKVSTNPASRQRILTALKLCPDLNRWRHRYERVAASAFCRGTNGRGWSADFWWVLTHGDEIDAGRYDDRADARAATRDEQDALWARVLGQAVSE